MRIVDVCSVLPDTMAEGKIAELVDAMTHGCLNTCHTTATLILALADSNGLLKAEQARCAHHQERLTTCNEAFATLIQLAMNSNKSIKQLTNSLTVANAAVSEGEHKLNQMDNTICQLNTMISRSTTDLNDARALGEQDRRRFLEVCPEKAQLQRLNGITSFTCRKLRGQRNDMDMQLHEVLAEQDSRRSTKATIATQYDFHPTLVS